MKKLTSVVLALAISGGLVYANFAYRAPVLDAANTNQIDAQAGAVAVEEVFNAQGAADDLLVARLNRQAELKLQYMIEDMNAKIESQLDRKFN